MKAIVLFLVLCTSIYSQINSSFIPVTYHSSSQIHDNEPCVAINPINNNFIVTTNYRQIINDIISEQKIGYYYTTNSGISWSQGVFGNNSIYQKYADPSVAFDINGNVFIGYLGAQGKLTNKSGIFVEKSTNGGQNWQNFIISEVSTDDYDKPFLTIDNSITSQYNGRVYISMTKGKEIKVSYFNNEINSFTTPYLINNPNDCLFAGASMPATDKNGNVYIIFLKKDLNENYSIQIVKSTNGGYSFTQESTIAPVRYITDNPGQTHLYTLGFRNNSIPSIAIDNSNNSNNIYVAWTEYIGDSNDDTAILFTKSTDGGSTWQSKNTINVVGLAETGHQFFPALDVDSESGRINLLYYQMESKISGVISPRLISSFDGGYSFYTDKWFEDHKDNFLYSESPFWHYLGETNHIGYFIGDYISVANEGDKIVTVWTSVDGNGKGVINGNLIENKLNCNISSTVDGQPYGRVTFNNGPPSFFNPSNPVAGIEYYAPLSYNFDTEPEYNFNGIINKFRVWENIVENNSPIYGEINTNAKPGYEAYGLNINANFQPTFPLTVHNNLEGGSGGTYQVSWDKKPSPPISQVSGTSYHAFDYNRTQDKYNITAYDQTALGTSWYFQKWSTGSTNNTLTNIQVSAPLSDTAYYKGNLRSNQTDAFNSNSQRKVVRDNNGIYHCVYTSMNKLWYTKSSTTDFGGSWTPEITFEIYSAEDEIIKNPSLDIYNNSITIVFEYGYPEFDGYQILTGQISGSVLTSIELVADIDISSFGHSYPVVAKFYDETFFIYKNSSSDPLKYKRKYLGNWSTEANLPNAGTNSKNPTMDKYISGTNGIIMAWQESNTTIKYQNAYNQGNNKNFENYSIPSNGSGYTYNHSPSLFAMGYGARMVWVGERDIIIEDANLAKENIIQREKRVVFKNPDYYRFWSFGNDVNAPSINTNDALNSYVYAWSENDGSFTNKFGDNYLSTIRTMNTYGKDIQVAKGLIDKSTMFGISFDSRTLPYNFTVSNSFAALSKENALAFSSGRQGIIYKDDAYFYFLLGDIKRNNLPVKFVEFPDTAYIQSLSDMNSYLVTEPFTLSDNTPFSFSAQYGLSDNLSTRLLENGSIRFRIDLVDNASGDVLGQFVDEEFEQNSYTQCTPLSYNLNTNGIGNRTVVLRVLIEYNQNAEFSVGDILADIDLLPKMNAQEISFKGNLAVKEYALEQNYPNPFNPSTTISYSIPKDGHVLLKIYDILGNELLTLISKYQPLGKYTVSFNAENLASGVYLYRLQVKDFVSSKKMTLIK